MITNPFNNIQNNYNNKKSQSKIKFGCRMMAFANSNTNNEDDSFRLRCIVKDDNSLKNQSRLRLYKSGNASNPFDYEDLFGLRKEGNLSGWGFGCFDRQTNNPFILKGILPAFQDNKFDSSADNIMSKHSKVVFVHVRAASDECHQVNMNNVHPFVYKNWLFMHNGTVPGAMSKPIQNKIKEYSKYLGELPKGNTDSEATFYYFMGKLHEKYGTTDSDKVGKENLKATFAETISDLIENSPKNYQPLDGSIIGIKGEMATKPSCNFIASDGKNILAFHRGAGLYLGEKILKDGKKDYVLSSEEVDGEDIKWTNLPQNHMILLSKDENGNFTPEMEPLSKYVKKNVL